MQLARGAALPAVDLVNEVRRAGCGKYAPVRLALESDPGLDRVARQLHDDESLERALSRANYRALQSASIRLSGFEEPAARAALSAQFCRTVMNEAFTAVGRAQRDRDVWIVLARPFAPPAKAERARIASEALRLVNAARAQGRRCGSRQMAAAPPLSPATLLNKVAQVHADDMAARGVLAHTGSDGSTVAQRASRAGFRHDVIGENVAGGPVSAAIVVQEWLDSPGHCENLMDARFTQMGVAYAVNAAAPLGIYWSQVLGAP